MDSLILQAIHQDPAPIRAEIVGSGFPWSALFGFLGVFVGAGVAYLFNRKLETYRESRLERERQSEGVGLLQVFIIEAVFILERCVQYVRQAETDTKISKSTIHLQFGASQLARLLALGVDWRLAQPIYTIYEIAGQVQRQLDRMPADFMNNPDSRMVADNYFKGIPSFVDPDTYQNKLLASIETLLDSAEAICPHEFVSTQRVEVPKQKKIYDSVRPPKPEGGRP